MRPYLHTPSAAREQFCIFPIEYSNPELVVLSTVELDDTTSDMIETKGPAASRTIQPPSIQTTMMYDTEDIAIAKNVPSGISFWGFWNKHTNQYKNSGF